MWQKRMIFHAVLITTAWPLLLGGVNPCKAQEMASAQRGVTIATRSVMVHSLCVVDLLRVVYSVQQGPLGILQYHRYGHLALRKSRSSMGRDVRPSRLS